MGLTGLEPVTLRLSSACSNQLSYRPACAENDFGFGARRAQDAFLDFRRRAAVAIGSIRGGKAPVQDPSLEARGFEPLTSSLQSWRSTN